MYGANTGTQSVRVQEGSGLWKTIYSIPGNQGSQWKVKELSLNPYYGKNICVQAVATEKEGWIAIDQLYIQQG